MNWFNKLLGNKIEGIGKRVKGSDGQGAGRSLRKNIFEGLEGLRFGRYSDNNKTFQKTQKWYEAEDFFKEKKYNEAFEAFFEYLTDDEVGNVAFEQNGDTFTVDLVQGSKKIHGKCDGKVIIASAPLASMPEPSTAVMRRLLDMNFNLYYSRAAMDDKNTLCLIFDTDISSVNNNKLYYGLRELATKADSLDDILLADFSMLKPAGMENIQPLDEKELDIKYRYFRKWIENGLKMAKDLHQDSFSGAIAYILPLILYRIDFLITPEAKMLGEMERISSIYWAKKEEVTLVERNRMMMDSIRKMLDTTKEQFAANVYKSKSTFSISVPPKPDKIKDNVYHANKDSRWYMENKYPAIALELVEYGLLYSHFIYSMPAVITNLTVVFMAVLHQEYFTDLGMVEKLYDPIAKTFNKEAIKQGIDNALDGYRDKFKSMKWDHSRIRYNSLYDFAVSFSEQTANLNLETKR